MRLLMQREQMSIADLSVATGLSRWALYKYASVRREHGRRPGEEAAVLIADALQAGQESLYRCTAQDAA